MMTDKVNASTTLFRSPEGVAVKSRQYQAKYKELDGILAVFCEEKSKIGTVVLVKMTPDKLKDFRQRIEEAYGTLLGEDATTHHIKRLYLLPTSECASLSDFISSQDRMISSGMVGGPDGAELRKQIHANRKGYLEKHARILGVVELGTLRRNAKSTPKPRAKPVAVPKLKSKPKTKSKATARSPQSKKKTKTKA